MERIILKIFLKNKYLLDKYKMHKMHGIMVRSQDVNLLVGEENAEKNMNQG